MENNKHLNCLVCNSQNIGAIKGYEMHQLGKCNDCGFVFMLRIPSQQELADYYSVYSYGKEQYLSPLTIDSYNKLLDEMEPYRRSNNLLDVGCGQGWFLDVAKKRGWNVYGTEYSDVAVKKCRDRGINILQGDLNPADFKGIEIDVIVSFEVIEHINHPNSELQKIYSLLRKGGLFYLTTPNFNCYLRHQVKDKFSVIHYPEHLSYYTPTTLHRVLKQNGFKKNKMLTTGISITRFEQAKGKKTEVIAKNTSDEKLRETLNSNGLMQFVKKSANQILTITGLGLTLKGYYTK